jgi:hypothetical protein
MAEMMHGLYFLDKLLNHTWNIECILLENLHGNRETLTHRSLPDASKDNTKGPIPNF